MEELKPITHNWLSDEETIKELHDYLKQLDQWQ